MGCYLEETRRQDCKLSFKMLDSKNVIGVVKTREWDGVPIASVRVTLGKLLKRNFPISHIRIKIYPLISDCAKLYVYHF